MLQPFVAIGRIVAPPQLKLPKKANQPCRPQFPMESFKTAGAYLFIRQVNSSHDSILS